MFLMLRRCFWLWWWGIVSYDTSFLTILSGVGFDDTRSVCTCGSDGGVWYTVYRGLVTCQLWWRSHPCRIKQSAWRPRQPPTCTTTSWEIWSRSWVFWLNDVDLHDHLKMVRMAIFSFTIERCWLARPSQKRCDDSFQFFLLNDVITLFPMVSCLTHRLWWLLIRCRL